VIGADLRIVAADGGIGDILPAGVEGEVAVSGPSLALGYWKDPEKTRARFIDGWWRSGDMGSVDEEGDLFITGRTDNLINSGGIKVHAEEIERALLAHPEVVQAAVVGQPDDRWGQRIEAYVVLRGAGLAADALEAHCRATGLAGFKLPKVFRPVASLPTGPTGKLYRRALRTPREDRQES
jgi:acyl-CoA synthetase (AMP-forming)/AMP-acid ligase II